MTDLPPGWDVRPLAEIADYETGRTPPRTNPSYWNDAGEPVTWVTISDLPAYGVVTRTKEKVSRAAFETVFHGNLVPAGTLLMSFKLTIGRVATLGVPATHNEAIISIYPKPSIDQRYLGYYLSQVDYAAYQDRQIKGNTLNKAKLDRIPVAVPPEAAQKAIAHLLDCVRAAIELEQELVTASRRLKSAAMLLLCTRGRQDEPTKETEIGPVPVSWAVRPLGDVCPLSTGTTPSTNDPSYYRGDIPFVKTADVVNNRLSMANTFISDRAMRDYNLKLFPPGTVLMAMYGQGKTRGQVSLLEIAATTTQNAAAIQPSADIHPAFLWHYLMSQYERLRGMGSLGHVSHLNLGYLQQMPVVVPPLADQRDIAAALDTVDSKIDLHKERLARLDELFSTLLYQVMTGAVHAGDLDTSAFANLTEPGESAA